MEGNCPLVTIGAFNYNNARFVIEALDSIKNQTYSSIELIIVDDCSTDNSVELITQWLRSYEKPYRLYIHSENRGLKFGLREAIDKATGKYFSILATDDVMIHDKIEDQVVFIESHNEDVGLVYGDCVMIDENSNIIEASVFEFSFGANFTPPSGNIFRVILDNFYFYSQASLINLQLFKQINFSFDKRIISEDWDMEIAIARNFSVYGSKKICTKYRKVSTSVTSTLWTVEKIHLVKASHFIMFSKYLNNVKNSEEENAYLFEKLRFLYWDYSNSKNSTYKNKMIFFLKILYETKDLRDLLTFLKIVLLLK